jgi:synaptic vesicle membrane protein VAT-1
MLICSCVFSCRKWMTTISQWRCVGGSIGNLKLVSDACPPPAPDKGWITVDVKAIGLNFADVFSCVGLYSATPVGEFTPGLEFAGTVSAVNSGDTKFTVGDKVLGVTRFGAYSTRLNIDHPHVRALPDGWTFEEGAAFPAQAMTAWYGLVELGAADRRVAAGKAPRTALVHSAAGGTGLWAVRILQHFGFSVVATVGSSAKVPELHKLCPGLAQGAIVDRSASGTPEALLKQGLAAVSATGFDIVFDSLLGDWFTASHELMNPQGRHVVLGAGSMTPHGDKPNWLSLGWKYAKRPRLDPLAMIATNKAVLAFNLIWLYDMVDQVGAIFDSLFEVIDSLGRPVVGHTETFDNLPAALRLFQSGTTVGKVIIKVAP